MGMRMYTHFKCITCIHMHTWFIHITFLLCRETTDLCTSIINAANILQIVIQHKVPSIGTFFCFPQVSFSPRNVFKVLSEAFLDSVLYKGSISPNAQQVMDLCWPFCVMGFIFSSETSASLSKLPDMEGDSFSKVFIPESSSLFWFSSSWQRIL